MSVIASYWVSIRASLRFVMAHNMFPILTVSFWMVRSWLDPNGAAQDAALLALFILPKHGQHVWTVIRNVVRDRMLPTTALLGSVIVLLLYSCSSLLGAQKRPGPQATASMQPLLFPARTKHTRLFPKKHSFSYSYLLLGVPVGWQGYIRNLASIDVSAMPRPPQRLGMDVRSWFSVDPADYLSRGLRNLGLEGKLHAYLRAQVCMSTLKAAVS